MHRVFAIILLAAALAACTDPDGAKRAAEASGIGDVRITGWRLWGCSDNDPFRTGFEGVSATGKPVSGVVCSGWFKGSTVRFD